MRRSCRRPARSRPIRRSSGCSRTTTRPSSACSMLSMRMATHARRPQEPVRPVVVSLARRRRCLRPGARAQAAAHRRGRLRPFDPRAVARAGRRRRDRGHRSLAARRHPGPAGRAGRAFDPAGRPARAVRRAAGRRCAVHQFQPYPDAGQRRRHPAEPRPADAAGRRAGPHPRHLPALRLSADLGLARLQRTAGRACRCW